MNLPFILEFKPLLGFSCLLAAALLQRRPRLFSNTALAIKIGTRLPPPARLQKGLGGWLLFPLLHEPRWNIDTMTMSVPQYGAHVLS